MIPATAHKQASQIAGPAINDYTNFNYRSIINDTSSERTFPLSSDTILPLLPFHLGPDSSYPLAFLFLFFFCFSFLPWCDVYFNAALRLGQQIKMKRFPVCLLPQSC